MYDLIELCAGTAAISLAALGAPVFPASRRGGKRGWTAPILEALTLEPPVGRALLVEIDPALCSLLVALFSDPLSVAEDVRARSDSDARGEWRAARVGSTPADALLAIAGSRGGVMDGGFKGGHARRPSVDGFTPSRRSLVERVREFARVRGRADVICADVGDVDAADHRPTIVYLDPPYAGRRGYGRERPVDAARVAERWRRVGHRVVVSEARPLPGACFARDVTALRAGQTRRSMVSDHSEWLSVFEP